MEISSTISEKPSVWQKFNNNPKGRSVGDCAVRALSVALGIDWEQAYILLVASGYSMADMPSSDSVMGNVLESHNFCRRDSEISSNRQAASDFVFYHPDGVYVLFFGGHVATAKYGVLYDAWDSSNELLLSVWRKEE